MKLSSSPLVTGLPVFSFLEEVALLELFKLSPNESNFK
jgi:hypothetical protein